MCEIFHCYGYVAKTDSVSRCTFSLHNHGNETCCIMANYSEFELVQQAKHPTPLNWSIFAWLTRRAKNVTFDLFLDNYEMVLRR